MLAESFLHCNKPWHAYSSQCMLHLQDTCLCMCASGTHRHLSIVWSIEAFLLRVPWVISLGHLLVLKSKLRHAIFCLLCLSGLGYRSWCYPSQGLPQFPRLSLSSLFSLFLSSHCSQLSLPPTKAPVQHQDTDMQAALGFCSHTTSSATSFPRCHPGSTSNTLSLSSFLCNMGRTVAAISK